MTFDHRGTENVCASCPDAVRDDRVWRVLLVDPDQDTLSVLKLCLSSSVFDHRRLEISTARTIGEALFRTRHPRRLAAMVVAETVEEPGDGLKLIEDVRAGDPARLTAIVLRGEFRDAGSAAMEWACADRVGAERRLEALDVFDWRGAGEMSLSRLRAMLTSALAAHRDRLALDVAERSRRVLDEALKRAATDDPADFVRLGLIESVHRLARIGREPEVCARTCGLVAIVDGCRADGGADYVVAAHGSMAGWAGSHLDALPDTEVTASIRRAARSGASAWGGAEAGPGGMALTIRRGDSADLVVFLASVPDAVPTTDDAWRIFAMGVGAALRARAATSETARERGRREAAEERCRITELAMEGAPAPIIHVSASGEVLGANPPGALIAGGWRKGEDGTRRCPWGLPESRVDGHAAGGGEGDSVPDGGERVRGVFELSTPAGDFEVTMSPRLPDGGAHLFFRDIGYARRDAVAAEWSASRDPLTGLLNRAELIRRLDARCRRRNRDAGGFALMIIDVDHFGHLNEDLGFDVADGAFRQLAARIRAILRVRDVLGRVGSDEFAVVLTDVDTAHGASSERLEALARRIGEAAERPMTVRGRRVALSVSIGMAVAPTDGREPEALVQAATLALEAARRDGVGTRFYQRRMDSTAAADRLLAAELAAALSEGGLELHYQPLVRLDDGKMVAAEALVRWNHPTRGFVGPDSFIPVAERSGLIGRLGAWVVEEACRRLAAWRAGPFADLRLSVNLSAIQLADPDLVEWTRATLERHGVPGASLKLEITETAAMSDVKRSMSVLWGLRELGVGLSIDDFGTGYSSLAHLRRLPVGEVKIDRAFIADIDSDEDALAIVRAIVSLGRGMGLSVVAEGVERPAQVSLLTTVGCDLAQGYLFGRPRAAEAFAAAVPTRPILIRSA